MEVCCSCNRVLAAPLQLITEILSSANPAAISIADRALYIENLKTTYLALGVINVIAIGPHFFK